MQKVFDLLYKAYYLNYPLIYALKHGAQILEANENGVALFRINQKFMLLAGSSLPEIIKNLSKPDWAELCGSQNVGHVAAHFGFSEVMECHQLYYPHKTIEFDLELEPLNHDNAAFVLEHYHRLDQEELHQAIEQQRIFGVRIQGQLFAFIGLHDDFAMGMLEVLPEYRRRGWGERLERALTAKVLSMGELPDGHVIAGNETSLRLQKKLGFVECSNKVYWMW
ncbi:MAG: GNAT family N-acetyltransferase [Chloroflexi bacterium]|jgi:GNAT superfamily N-acetyltransferase|nr:GNAT family N-acetyltransferase [Chloroflexota bacterium]